MEAVTVDDLAVGCTPRPCLQVRRDLTAFAETGKPLAQCQWSGCTKKGQLYTLGPEWRLVSGHIGAKQSDWPSYEVAMGNGIRRTVSTVELPESVQLNCTAEDLTVERQGFTSSTGKMNVRR